VNGSTPTHAIPPDYLQKLSHSSATQHTNITPNKTKPKLHHTLQPTNHAHPYNYDTYSKMFFSQTNTLHTIDINITWLHSCSLNIQPPGCLLCFSALHTKTL
jgi:hypothetical protein